MARKEIKNPMDDSALNSTNHNFIELYDGVQDASGKINKVEKDINERMDNFIDETSDTALDKVVDNAKLNWKGPVNTVSDLPADAKEGDVRMVVEGTEGVAEVYRYTDNEWLKIQEFDATAINELDSRLSSQLADMDEELKKSYLYEKVYGSLTKYEKPSEFNMDLPFDVFISKNGRVSYNYDVSKNKKEVTTRYYVDVVNGDNNNDGTKDSPFRDLNRAFRYNPVDEIVLKSGIYGWRSGEGNTSSFWDNHTFNIIGEGNVLLGAHREPSNWESVSGHEGVYKVTETNVVEVIDINDYDNPVFYERKTDVDDLINGSYYINGSDVYVKTLNGNIPNEFILLNMLNMALNLRDQSKVYIENIKFTNTLVFENEDTKGELYAKNCDFMFGSTKDALQINGDVYFELQNCRALYGDRDGFNYHVKNNKLPQGIEIDCYGAFNGRDGANQNNGSTMHDGGKIIRIGGEYHSNQGPNVIDVNPGTQSLNIGVHAHNSTSTSDLVNVDFRTRDADMWLVNCVSHDSKYSTSREGSASLTIENSLLIAPSFEG